MALHENDRDEVHSIAMRPFRSWAADAIDRVDPKLMRFDVPAVNGVDLGEEPSKCFEQLPPRARGLHARLYRLEPALDPPVQSVVSSRLPVRSAGDCSQLRRDERLSEAAVPAKSVPTAVAQIGIRREGFPGVPKCIQVPGIDARSCGESRGRQERVACGAEARDGIVTTRGLALVQGGAHERFVPFRRV